MIVIAGHANYTFEFFIVFTVDRFCESLGKSYEVLVDYFNYKRMMN